MTTRDDILHEPELDPKVAELIAAARAARPAVDPARVDATVTMLLAELAGSTAPEDEVTPPHLLPASARRWPRALWWWLGGALLVIAVAIASALLLSDDREPAVSTASDDRAELVDDIPPVDEEALLPTPKTKPSAKAPKVEDDSTSDGRTSDGSNDDGVTRRESSTSTRPARGGDSESTTEDEDADTVVDGVDGDDGAADPEPTRPTPTTPTPTTPTPTTPTPTTPVPTTPDPGPSTPAPTTPTPNPPIPTVPTPGGPTCDPATGAGCPAPQHRPDQAVGER